MRQTYTYTSDHYNRDNGFPLAWMCRCCIGKDMKGTEVEAGEHFQQKSDARQGKIIGRPAHLAGPRKSPAPMKYSSAEQEARELQSDPAKPAEPAKQPQTQTSPTEQRENESPDISIDTRPS